MNNEALALVIAGACLHAVWNLCAKKAAGGLAFVWLFGVVSIAAALPFGIFAWHAHSQQLTGQAWLAIVVSALIHVAYSLVLQKGYRESDFSVVYPLARGTGPLFAVFGAIAFLGETPSALGCLGIAAILVGIFIVSGIGKITGVEHKKVTAGIFWGCLTGLFIAAYTVVDGWAVKSLGLAPVLYYVLGLALRTLVLAPQALREPQALRLQWQKNSRYIVAVGVLSPLAFSLALQAMVIAPLSYVAPVRELSMLLGVVLGGWFLREAISMFRVVGAVCMVLGVVLLAVAK